jgi:hypothetical protein
MVTPPDKEPEVSLSSKVEQIAKMLRVHTKPTRQRQKRSTVVLSDLSPVNTIEQVAKLLRSQASKVHKIKQNRFKHK